MLRSPFVLLLTTGLALADDAVDLQWKLHPQDLATYGVSIVSDANGQLQVTPQPTRSINLFGYEIDAKGATTNEPANYMQIHVPWLLLLPKEKVKPGAVARLAKEYALMSGVNPFAAHGTLTFQGYDDLDKVHTAVLVTKLDLVADKDPSKQPPNNEYFQTVGEGKLEVTQWFDPDRGVLVRVRYDLSMKLCYSEKYREQLKKQNNTDLKDYEYRVREQWDLKDVQDIAKIDLGPDVRKAIDKGVGSLRGKQEADGGWDSTYKQSQPGGATALVLLALLKAGASPKDPAIEKGFAYLKKQPFEHTYTVGLIMMAIEAKYISPDEVRNSESFLEGKQSELKLVRRDLSKEDQAWMLAGANWLDKAMTKDGAWSYDAPSAGKFVGGFDNSNSQYGVLGLLSAARCGIQIGPKVWSTVLDHWLNTQEAKGPADKLLLRSFNEKDAREVTVNARGWGYNDASKTTVVQQKNAPPIEVTRGSMTCAGIAAVCMARSQLAAMKALTPDKARACDKSVYDGLAWMKGHYTVKEEVYGAGWYHYYMYGLERAMVLAQQRYLADHDWYREGAIVLIHTQMADGAWQTPVETSFSILFLKRATTPIGQINTK